MQSFLSADNETTTQLPNVTVVKPDLEDEYARALFTLPRLEFYKEHGVKGVILPSGITNDLKVEAEMGKDLLHQAIAAEYDADFYESALSILTESMGAHLDFVLPKFIELADAWGFYTPDYSIQLTRYGSGGSYNPRTGLITLRVNSDLTFDRSNPFHTVVHEMLHIGIYDLIQQYNFSHNEIEDLVNSMYIALFGDMFGEYKARETKASTISDFINAETLKDLPQVLDQYRDIYPLE